MINAEYNPEFSIRKSQLLTPYGTGALTDINNQSVMIADSEYWVIDKDINIIHDIRLEKRLDATGFVRPPDVNQKKEIAGKRFPTWFYTPNGRNLKPFREWYEEFEKSHFNDTFNFEKEPYDARDRTKAKLVPVRLICACSNGHAQDFPWSEWVHESSSNDYVNHDLKLKSSGRTSSISDLRISCATCNKSKSLSNIFDVKQFNDKLQKIGVSCEGNFIWKKDEQHENCNASLNVLLKNSNSFYFPNIASSVNIPFKENRIYEEVLKSEHFPSLISEIERSREELTDFNSFKEHIFLERIFENIFEELNDYSPEEIMKAVYRNKIENANEYEELTEMEFRREEYEVLAGLENFDKESSRLNLEFINKSEFKDEKYGDVIENITLANKLEVIRVLESYSRIRPSESEFFDDDNTDRIESKKVSLRRRDNRYIGVDVLGEGIFITFNNSSIKKWLSKIDKAGFSNKINKKINNSYNREMVNFITPTYYLLHTLSHILIKELSETSGYSSSALSERLYYSNEKGKEMCGILIFTSSSDSEGTLGGLVKQGYPKNFMRVLNSAIDKAKWCSFDPVCITTDSQGRDSLNGSACHACSLISETSCEHSNLYLDRSMLIGDLENPEYGFFS